MRKVMVSIVALLAVLTLLAFGLTEHQWDLIPGYFSQMASV